MLTVAAVEWAASQEQRLRGLNEGQSSGKGRLSIFPSSLHIFSVSKLQILLEPFHSNSVWKTVLLTSDSRERVRFLVHSKERSIRSRGKAAPYSTLIQINEYYEYTFYLA